VEGIKTIIRSPFRHAPVRTPINKPDARPGLAVVPVAGWHPAGHGGRRAPGRDRRPAIA